MNKKFVALMLVCVLAFSMVGVGTMAWFTSSATSANNVFTVGSLKLGGFNDKDGNGVQGDGENDTIETFKAVTFGNMEPGEPPTKIQTTTLKNVGTLNFYIYRLTASGLVDNTTAANGNDNGKNDTLMDGKLMVDVEIGSDAAGYKKVFHGRLSEMITANGGGFDPIYMLAPGEVKTMKITGYLDTATDSWYQNLSMSCNFTVYANQNPSQLPGKTANWENLGTSNTQDAEIDLNGLGNIRLFEDVNFTVSGKNNTGDMQFKYAWNKAEEFKILGDNFIDKFDYYDVVLKHQSGKPNMQIVIRTYLGSRQDKDVFVGDYGNLTPRTDLETYVSADKIADVITINKSIFDKAFTNGDDWEMVDVKFAAALLNNALLDQTIWNTDYYLWSIK